MSVLVLPIKGDRPHFEFFTDLDDNRYGFEFKWNEREEAWYMSINDTVGNPILSGRKVVIGISLIGRFASASLPPGALLAIDSRGTDTDPGLDDLGDRVKIVYFDKSEAP